MHLFWRGSWIETPAYEARENALTIAVELSIPLFRLENASERITRQPRRKAATFLRTDGPRSTIRKIRAKRQESRFTGDFRIVLILGRHRGSERPVIALACRVPPAAQLMPVHRDLVRELPEGCTADELLRIASFIASRSSVVVGAGKQSFLYSGMKPPAELVGCLVEAIEQRNAHGPMPASEHVTIQPPRIDNGAEDTALTLGGPRRPSAMPVALLGSGDYARTEIIPALKAAGLSLYSVSNREPQIAAAVAREHGFAMATTDSERAISDLPAPGLVVVATAHDSHARLASMAAAAGHRVFVEKPPAVSADDVRLLAEAMMAHPGAIEIGFNRRYHPLVLSARSQLERESGPLSITCSIKEIALEPDHWYLWPNQGTRITGNLCHWIDLAIFLLGRAPTRGAAPTPVSLTISPPVSGSARSVDEERLLAITFDDESFLSIFATSRGDDIRGVQEQIEIRRGKTTIAIDDLWKMRVRRDGRDRRSRTLFRRKGHTDMYRAALKRVTRGEAAIYPLRDMVTVSAIQIAASELARSDCIVGEIPAWAPTMLDHARTSV